MSNLIEQLEDDLKAAALERDAIRLSVLRLLKSALKNQQIEVGHELNAQEMLSIIQKEAKKRHDSVEAYKKAGRDDLADEELGELEVISTYLPAEMSDAELTALVERVISELNAQTMADMGKVIAAVMQKAEGKASGSRVSQVVKSKLGN